jgi:hypothetical protein
VPDQRTKLGDLPDWPLLMDEATLARFCSMQIPELRTAIDRGFLPRGRMVDGKLRWHIDQVRAFVSDLYGLDGTPVRRQASRQLAQEALDAFNAAPAARRGQSGRRQVVSVLPAGRDASSTAGPGGRR